MPVQEFNFDSQIARFVKFEAFSWYGAGAGLQYFNVKKTGILVVNESSYNLGQRTLEHKYISCPFTLLLFQKLQQPQMK